MISNSEFCTLQDSVKKNITDEVLNIALFTYLSRRLFEQCERQYRVSFAPQLTAHDQCIAARMLELGGSIADVENAIRGIEQAGSVADYLRSLPN